MASNENNLSEELQSQFNSNIQTQRFISIQQAAAYVSLSSKSIRRLIASQKLTALRPVKGRIVIDRLELERFVISSKSGPRKNRGRKN